ncbi:MAG: hypothetical protein AVDCRST_MAG93-1204, partial [uncultured Chloroflexia bacterium]
AGTDILMLSPDALRDDAEVRRYTRARDLILGSGSTGVVRIH